MMLDRLVAPDLAAQYTKLLSNGASKRDALFNSYDYTFADLIESDLQLHSYLDAMLLVKDNVQVYFSNLLTAPLSHGDLFAIGLFSIYTQNKKFLDICLSLSQVLPSCLPAIYHLIRWAPEKSLFWKYLDNYPLLKAYACRVRPEVGITVSLKLSEVIDALQKEQTIPSLLAVLVHTDEKLYYSLVNKLLQSENEHYQLHAITSVAQLPPDKIIHDYYPKLMQLSLSDDEKVSVGAIELFILNNPSAVSSFMHFLRNHQINKRAYIHALGLDGSPRHIDQLADYLNDPQYARISAAAITMITGATPKNAGWVGDALTSPQEERLFTASDVVHFDLVNSDPDVNLAWPDAVLFKRWWSKHRKFFPARNYLFGKPLTQEGLLSVIATGGLAARSIALGHYQQLTKQKLFDHRLSSLIQQRQIISLKQRSAS